MVLADGGFPSWLNSAFPDISSNLIAAAIGGFTVWLVTRTVRRLRLFRARRFWRAMGSRHPFIVWGSPDEAALTKWERSGMVGGGDILALVEIETQLRRLGFAGQIVESKNLTRNDLRSDLILIGGPDGNSTTATMMERLGDEISFGFTRKAATLYNKGSGATMSPEYDDSDRPVNDYGLIIRTTNPLAPGESEIVILAGCWGYGTAAAAEKLGDEKFLRRQRRSKHFEALVETTIVRDSYYNTKVRESRPIATSPAE